MTLIKSISISTTVYLNTQGHTMKAIRGQAAAASNRSCQSSTKKLSKNTLDESRLKKKQFAEMVGVSDTTIFKVSAKWVQAVNDLALTTSFPFV